MKYLVTGGAGFIGSHLCDRLLEGGNEVLCMDNFFTGSKQNIQHLSGHSGFEIIRHDVVDQFRVEVDAIYHLACPASPVHYQRYPISTTKCSILGAINVLDLADTLKVPVLFTSTSEVYGDPLVPIQSEDYFGNTNPIGPRACYDEGKRCAETLFMDYHKSRGVNVKIVRIFNTYGPRLADDDGRVVSNFIRQALRGEPVTVYGDGSQTRSFCYITDTVDGLVAAMASNGEFCGPVNIGNPQEVTMLSLANKIMDIANSSSPIVFKELPEGDPKQRRPDIGLAWHALGWSPRVSLEDGLRKTMAYFAYRVRP